MRTLLLTMLLGACAGGVDEEIPADYTSWPSWTVCGEVSGHGDSCRVIFANDLALAAWEPSEGPGYRLGAVIVKEIRENLDGSPGDIRYLGLMRRKYEIESALEQEGGWLFTIARPENDYTETYRSLCWARCHVAAPYNGAFYDYRNR